MNVNRVSQHSAPHFHGSSVFPPTGSPAGDKFISGVSISMFLCFFLLLRSAASPFWNPTGEPRRAASTSFYFNLSCFLYIWVLSSTTLTVLPHFSSHYNGVIAAALFFPMMFSSVATLLTGRFIVRLLYFTIKSGTCLFQPTTQQQAIDGNTSERTSTNTCSRGGGDKYGKMNVWEIIKSRKQKRRKAEALPKMIPFHRPFRKLAKSAATISAIFSLLHAHCWSRTLSVFKTHKDDGAGAVCRVIFSPFVPENGIGADEGCVWILWAICMGAMILFFAQDEFNGFHYRPIPEDTKLTRSMSNSASDDADDSDECSDPLDYSSDDSDPDPKVIMKDLRKRGIFSPRNKVEAPKDTLPMVPWLSLLAASSLGDIFLQLVVFMGRVDARAMQPALQDRKTWYSNDTKGQKLNLKDATEAFTHLQEKYPGCMFDYSKKSKSHKDGFWFDFMADCGDGFNSSYQVARLLAQQELTVNTGKGKGAKKMRLPRGELLVLGGDLAYPFPSEENYEKRFFRTFEDAMAPPPSFRRAKIATNKFNMSVKGWQKDLCFDDGYIQESDTQEDRHDQYKGPSTFVVPGNHDWHDGSATFSRFILCREWLGGWFMPQQRSYFAIKLPNGWWVFGMDCALSADIDIEQFKFFADVADKAVKSTDSVVLVNHEPHWVTDFENGKSGNDLSERNIQELMDHYLKGKVRVRLAGDLHHYTRHIPVASSKRPLRRSRSFSFDDMPTKRVCNDTITDRMVEPFEEESKPDLIVSGGGGAFLHGVHGYAKDITVGPKERKYSRVATYPSESVSRRLGWLNMWNFRWRNWRCDLVFAFLYLGIVSSLYPLCGILDEYEDFNPQHDHFFLVLWLLKKIWSLIMRIVSAEKWSLLSCSGFFIIALALQTPEHHVKPAKRFFVVFCHGLAHISAALSCLIFLQCVTEWSVREGIVSIMKSTEDRHVYSTPVGGISASIYGEYKEHFYPILNNFTTNDSSFPRWDLAWWDSGDTMRSIINAIRHFVEYASSTGNFLFSTVPLLKTTLNFFDLPSVVAQNHHDMCAILCASGVECLDSHDASRYLSIKREVFVPYLAAITLYFIFLAIPIGASIFGTWLSFCLNILKCQNDLGFSSLTIQHYKNFIKLHIKNNGELDIYAIGLEKVPTKWIKDPRHGNHTKRKGGTRSISPSWLLKTPSKWIPMREARCHVPQIVDHTSIPKRRIKSA